MVCCFFSKAGNIFFFFFFFFKESPESGDLARVLFLGRKGGAMPCYPSAHL